MIQAKRCKGLGYVHYILPAAHPPKINEILGYCSPCWTRQLVADNYHPTTQEQTRKLRKNVTFAGKDLL